MTASRVGFRSQTVRNGRWEFLDAVRGIAALIVLLQHSAEIDGRFAAFTNKYVSFGETGVVAFFLVSGYIIPVSLERYQSAKAFWTGRAFRLLPLYWATLIVVVLLDLARGSEGFILHFAHPARYLAGNLTLAQGILHVPYALYGYWTLAYEVIFYIACTILFVFGLHRRSRAMAIGATVVLLLGNIGCALALHHALSAEKLGVLVTAFIGAAFYRYSLGEFSSASLYLPLGLMAVAVPVANWLRLSVYKNEGIATPAGPLSSDMSFLLGYAIFLALFLLRGRQFPPVLLWLGKISYSVYLVHGIVLMYLPGKMNVWLHVAMALCITLLISHLTYAWIEQPPLAMQKHLFPRKSIVANQDQSPQMGHASLNLIESGVVQKNT